MEIKVRFNLGQLVFLKTDNEQLFINIVIFIIWTFYIYEVCMFINRTFIRR